MLDDISFVQKYDYLFDNGIMKFILSKQQYELLNLNRLLIKNNFKFSDDEKENICAKLLVIASLAHKYKILDEKYTPGVINKFLELIDNQINTLLNIYGVNSLEQLKKVSLYEKDMLNKIDEENAIKLSIKYNIKIDGYLNKELEKIKKQVNSYGNIVPYVKINFLEISKKTRNMLYQLNIKTIADIYDIYNNYVDYKLPIEIKNELFEYMYNKGFDPNNSGQNQNNTYNDTYLLLNQANLKKEYEKEELQNITISEDIKNIIKKFNIKNMKV